MNDCDLCYGNKEIWEVRTNNGMPIELFGNIVGAYGRLAVNQPIGFDTQKVPCDCVKGKENELLT